MDTVQKLFETAARGAREERREPYEHEQHPGRLVRSPTGLSPVGSPPRSVGSGTKCSCEIESMALWHSAACLCLGTFLFFFFPSKPLPGRRIMGLWIPSYPPPPKGRSVAVTADPAESRTRLIAKQPTSRWQKDHDGRPRPTALGPFSISRLALLSWGGLKKRKRARGRWIVDALPAPVAAYLATSLPPRPRGKSFLVL